MNRALPAALLAFALALPARAAGPSPVKMEAEAGIGNVTRAGVWMPVRVSLENPGAPFSGRVIVEYRGASMTKASAVEPIELATNAKKEVTLYARVGSPQKVDVRLEDSRGRERASPVGVQVSAIEDRIAIVGMVSMGARGDPGMRPLITAQTRITALDADELPESWPAYRALDALVLRDPDTAKLGPARVEAIKEWVASGGTLVVVTAEKWRAMDEPSFTELLPVRVTGVRSVAAADLPYPFSEHGAAPAIPGATPAPSEIAVAVAQPLRGSTRMEALGSPFLAEGRYGLGRVVFLAADPGDLPDVPAEEKAALWAGILALPAEIEDNPSNPNYYNYGAQSAEGFISQELSRIPPLKPPSVILVTLLIGLYVLVVGPGDYFLLKRANKLHWTWITYPVAITVFSGLIYAYARLSRSSDMMIRTLTLIDATAEPPGAPSPMHVYGGVYSPRAGRYEVRVLPAHALTGGLSGEENPYGMSATSSTEYESTGGKHPEIALNIPIWSMAGVDLTTSTTEPAPFLVERESDGKVKITNTGSDALVWVGLLIQGRVIEGGPLEPGKDVTLARDMPGKKTADLSQEMSSAMFGDQHNKEDLGRIVRVFAYATDPPTAESSTDPYYLPRAKRRLSVLERPRGDKGSPMVFAVRRDASLAIAIKDEHAAGQGLTIWRRPAPAIPKKGNTP